MSWSKVGKKFWDSTHWKSKVVCPSTDMSPQADEEGVEMVNAPYHNAVGCIM
jgi:hypothetical protein